MHAAFEPVTERAVADLVVVLQKIDEGGRGKLAARLAAQLAAAMRRRLALIDKAGAERARNVAAAATREVAVIALGLAGQQHMPGMMIVVVPLRSVFAARRILSGIQQARSVVVVFKHEMNMPAGFRGEIADGAAEIIAASRFRRAR